MRDLVPDEDGLDHLDRRRAGRLVEEVELVGSESAERGLHRPQIGGEDDGARRQGRGEVLGLGGEGDDAVERRCGLGGSGVRDVDPVVADLADRKPVELRLRDLEHDPVRPGAARVRLEVQADAVWRHDPGPGVREGLLGREVVPHLRPAAAPAGEATDRDGVDGRPSVRSALAALTSDP